MKLAAGGRQPLPLELQDSILQTEVLGLRFVEIRKQVCTVHARVLGR